MRNGLIATAIVVMCLGVPACQSKHEEGVTSNYRSQWTSVAADTRATTAAAEAVLQEEGLKDVHSNSTNVDGSATGKNADGTAAKASVEKVTDSSSQVSVTTRTPGDPAPGPDVA